jgi:hypothetical protein
MTLSEHVTIRRALAKRAMGGLGGWPPRKNTRLSVDTKGFSVNRLANMEDGCIWLHQIGFKPGPDKDESGRMRALV